ncbi:hypothetical protein QE152_g29016 [Popillia japonica]|uniref:BEN domain-containing protein n=1 Tax=Popillia japonica TaxID=7064 RepID=A0AAW1JKQ7_POPJA
MHLEVDGINEATGTPDIIEYNQTKGGVDVVDKLWAKYNCARATRRWPIVISAVLSISPEKNAYIIYKANTQIKIPRRKFLDELGFALLDEHIRRRSQETNIPTSIRTRLINICGIHKENESAPRLKAVVLSAVVKKIRKTRMSYRRELITEAKLLELTEQFYESEDDYGGFSDDSLVDKDYESEESDNEDDTDGEAVEEVLDNKKESTIP